MHQTRRQLLKTAIGGAAGFLAAPALRLGAQQPGNEKLADDLHHFLEKCIRALPRLQREAVKLAFFEGLSHREIAAVTHAPLGTVKTRLELGLRKLAHSIRPLRDKV